MFQPLGQVSISSGGCATSPSTLFRLRGVAGGTAARWVPRAVVPLVPARVGPDAHGRGFALAGRWPCGPDRHVASAFGRPVTPRRRGGAGSNGTESSIRQNPKSGGFPAFDRRSG